MKETKQQNYDEMCTLYENTTESTDALKGIREILTDMELSLPMHNETYEKEATRLIKNFFPVLKAVLSDTITKLGESNDIAEKLFSNARKELYKDEESK